MKRIRVKAKLKEITQWVYFVVVFAVISTTSPSFSIIDPSSNDGDLTKQQQTGTKNFEPKKAHF